MRSRQRARRASSRIEKLDGVDLLPYLKGGTGEPHNALFWRGGKARAVRKGKWKLLEFGDGLSRLYDLEADLGEKDDVSERHPGAVRDLREQWRAWSAGMKPAAWPPRYRELTVNGVAIDWGL